MYRTILITGASGFIGTNLVDLFNAKGYKFVNFDKSKPLNPAHEKYWVEGNIMNLQQLENVFEKYKPDCVVHLAAKADCESDNIDDYFENTKGTENVLNTIKQFDCVRNVLITSTQYVYKSKNIPFPERDDIYKPHLTYGESKVITEKLTRSADLNCNWTIIRPANIWGPWHMRYPNELWKVIKKGYYIQPSLKPVIRTYGYVKNIVHQIHEIIFADPKVVDKQTFYVGDNPIDSYEWLNGISMQIKKKRIRRIPAFTFYLPALAGEVLNKIGIKFPLHMVRYKNMIEDFYSPTNTTVKLFGVYNSSMQSNIQETLDWIDSLKQSKFPNW